MNGTDDADDAACCTCSRNTWRCLACRYNEGDTYAVRILSPSAAHRPVIGHLRLIRSPKRQ